jgi:predicted metal-dependent phosphoesterase TrpH
VEGRDEKGHTLVRCDLHVHSLRSGAVDLPLLRHVGRESYSEPRAVYDMALNRGMDLVTLTDHDTIDGALEIESLPGTFVSEEVTVELPGDRELHVGVLDITEAQHEQIQRARTDPEAFFAYLREQRISAVVNHLFSALTGKRKTEDFPLALSSGIPLIEARNGMMNERTNAFAVAVGAECGLAPIGGSDAHALASVATAYTVVEGARTKEEFLLGLRRGAAVPGGRHGSYAKLTRDVALVFAGGYEESFREALTSPAALARFGALVAALPLMPLIPLVTAAIYTHEKLFAEHHHRLYRALADPARPASGAWGAASSAVQL